MIFKNNIFYLFLLIQTISFSQDYISYFTGDTADITTNPQYGVCLMGGATEHDEAMKWFLQKADGGDVVVLRASGSDGYNDYFFSELGITINSVETLLILNPNGAVDPYVLQQVENAEAIWFAGGNQYNYVQYFKNNAMETILNNHINIKQAVIGGTSAGMAIMGGYYFDAENGTVSSYQALQNPYHAKVSLGYHDFLEIPFLENTITDSHYDDPDRRGRHTAFLARYATDIGSRSFGIACNEYTAVCIDENADVFVYGDYPSYEEFAYFLQANCVENFSPENCTSGTPLTWLGEQDAVRVYKVPGTNTGQHFFNIEDWQTGSGGTWENWFVNEGNITYTYGENPECEPLFIEENDLQSLHVYPNPFKDKINFTPFSAEVHVTLYDVFGRIITSKTNFNLNYIETKSLTEGIYFLKVELNTSKNFYKLYKE